MVRTLGQWDDITYPRLNSRLCSVVTETSPTVSARTREGKDTKGRGYSRDQDG